MERTIQHQAAMLVKQANQLQEQEEYFSEKLAAQNRKIFKLETILHVLWEESYQLKFQNVLYPRF